jgi:pSer/pThr/pTyr-binding forkhead associated (FHA) protein
VRKKAGGWDMARIIIKTSDGLMDRTIELKSGVNRIGRNESNDIVLPYTEVSSFHCEILVDKEFVFVRDMNSSNGTFVNGEAVNDTALYSGQVLEIADVKMELHGEETASPVVCPIPCAMPSGNVPVAPDFIAMNASANCVVWAETN